MFSIGLFLASQISAYVLSFVYMPAFAFLGYQAVYFFYHNTRWWYWQVPDLPYSFGMSLLVLGLAVADRKRTTKSSVIGAPPLRWMWLLVGFYAITYIWSVRPDAHLESFDDFLKLVVVVTCAYKLCSNALALNYYLYGYVFGASYLGYYLLEIGRNAGERVTGFGVIDSPDVNDLAAVIAPAAIFALHYFLLHIGWRRILIIIGGALIVNALVLINSRGAFLGLFVGSTFYVVRVYLLGKKVNISRMRVVFVVLLGLLALVQVFDETAVRRILGLQEEASLTEEQQTGSTRVFFWKAAIEMSRDYPYGLGSSAFVAMSPNYIPDTVNTGASRNRAVHSSWFQTLTEIGYPGLFLFIMMLLSAFSVTQKALKQTLSRDDARGTLTVLAIQAGLISYLVSATFIDRMRAVVLYWLIMYAACAYNVYVKQGKQYASDTCQEKGQSAENGKLKLGINHTGFG
ncbi:MAG: O-antigen ligase family protein [Pseudomonadales bacterium]|nr:O-antigen ligase family protein [Pseudomonadales bacterium]